MSKIGLIFLVCLFFLLGVQDSGNMAAIHAAWGFVGFCTLGIACIWGITLAIIANIKRW